MRKGEIIETLTGLALVCLVVGFTVTLVKQHGDPSDATPQQELAAAARSAKQDKQSPPAVPAKAKADDDDSDVGAAIGQARRQVDATNHRNRQNQAAIRNR